MQTQATRTTENAPLRVETHAAAIIIPHYNDETRLMRCLEKLVPQLRADIDVVVVDNGSKNLPHLPKAWSKHIRVLSEPQPGAAMARNRGVAETSAPLLFFIDSDCVPSDDWVACAFQANTAADIVGGTVTVFDETSAPRSGAEAFETVFAFDNRNYIETKGFSVTANLLTRRDVFEDVGLFYAGVSEDFDWCQRATAKGYRLIHTDALRVAHPTRSDWAALSRKWRRLTIESWGLQGRGPAARGKWVLRALAMPLSVLAHLPKVAGAPSLSGPERWRAAATLWRLRLTRAVWMLQQALGWDL